MERKEYYTAEEAINFLKKTKTTFYREAKAGVYPFMKVKGRIYFPKQAIEDHASLMKEREEKEKPKENQTLRFIPATNMDIWQRIQYNLDIYGPEDMISYKRALEWRMRNPDISMSVYEGERQAGGVTIMPIDEPVILALANDEIREKDILLETIREWTDVNLCAYVPTISIVKCGDAKRDRKVAAFLIKNTIRWAMTLHMQYDIKRWYGIGTTPEGQQLMEAFGFKEFLSLESGERKAYCLDNLQKGSHLLKHFLQKIEDTSHFF